MLFPPSPIGPAPRTDGRLESERVNAPLSAVLKRKREPALSEADR
jgi:hypothetical protein